MIRVLAILFVLSIAVSFGVSKGLEMWRESQPAAGPLVPPRPPVPRAMRTSARSTGGAPCPDLPLWELFDGELAGLASVDAGGSEAVVLGSVPGTRPAGPEPLPRLTVVDSEGSTITRLFDLTKNAAPGSDGAPAGFSLRVPVAGPARDRVAFVTSACLPNSSARGRWWSYLDPQPIAPDEQQHILEEIADYLGATHWLKPGSTLASPGRRAPTRLGVLPFRGPGCRRLVIFNDQQSRHLLASKYYSALFCIDGNGDMTRAPLPPSQGSMITRVGVIDIDGDHRDEIVVTQRKFDDAGLHGETDELLWQDPETLELRAEVLRRPQ